MLQALLSAAAGGDGEAARSLRKLAELTTRMEGLEGAASGGAAESEYALLEDEARAARGVPWGEHERGGLCVGVGGSAGRRGWPGGGVHAPARRFVRDHARLCAQAVRAAARRLDHEEGAVRATAVEALRRRAPDAFVL